MPVKCLRRRNAAECLYIQGHLASVVTLLTRVTPIYAGLFLCAVLLLVFTVALHKWSETASVRHSAFHIYILSFTFYNTGLYTKCTMF